MFLAGLIKLFIIERILLRAAVAPFQPFINTFVPFDVQAYHLRRKNAWSINTLLFCTEDILATQHNTIPWAPPRDGMSIGVSLFFTGQQA
jgi:hypothetical protein